MPNMRLLGKTVVVTGAASGIGAECVRRYVKEGAQVVCVDVSPSLDAVIAKIDSSGSRAIGIVADISTREGNERAVAAALSRTGTLDVFHANAAVQVVSTIEGTRREDWARMQSVNLQGAFLGVQAAIPPMRAGGGGSIILTASVLGLAGDKGLAAYGAMKGGLVSLAKAVAAEHGPDGIRCNTICPGDIETSMVSEYFAAQDDPIAARAQVEARYPMRRLGRPDEVASVATFLASDDSSFVSGVDLVVDGGLLASVY